MKTKKVIPIEIKDGKAHFNLACDLANSDPIRAARLLEQGKNKELKEMEQTEVYEHIPSNS
jgi:hypothetical protein